MNKKLGKIITKNLSRKCSQKLPDHATKSARYTENCFKKSSSKIAEVTFSVILFHLFIINLSQNKHSKSFDDQPFHFDFLMLEKAIFFIKTYIEFVDWKHEEQY